MTLLFTPLVAFLTTLLVMDKEPHLSMTDATTYNNDGFGWSGQLPLSSPLNHEKTSRVPISFQIPLLISGNYSTSPFSASVTEEQDIQYTGSVFDGQYIWAVSGTGCAQSLIRLNPDTPPALLTSLRREVFFSKDDGKVSKVVVGDGALIAWRADCGENTSCTNSSFGGLVFSKRHKLVFLVPKKCRYLNWVNISTLEITTKKGQVIYDEGDLNPKGYKGGVTYGSDDGTVFMCPHLLKTPILKYVIETDLLSFQNLPGGLGNTVYEGCFMSSDDGRYVALVPGTSRQKARLDLSLGTGSSRGSVSTLGSPLSQIQYSNYPSWSGGCFHSRSPNSGWFASAAANAIYYDTPENALLRTPSGWEFNASDPTTLQMNGCLYDGRYFYFTPNLFPRTVVVDYDQPGAGPVIVTTNPSTFSSDIETGVGMWRCGGATFTTSQLAFTCTNSIMIFTDSEKYTSSCEATKSRGGIAKLLQTATTEIQDNVFWGREDEMNLLHCLLGNSGTERDAPLEDKIVIEAGWSSPMVDSTTESLEETPKTKCINCSFIIDLLCSGIDAVVMIPTVEVRLTNLHFIDSEIHIGCLGLESNTSIGNSTTFVRSSVQTYFQRSIFITSSIFENSPVIINNIGGSSGVFRNSGIPDSEAFSLPLNETSTNVTSFRFVFDGNEVKTTNLSTMFPLRTYPVPSPENSSFSSSIESLVGAFPSQTFTWPAGLILINIGTSKEESGQLEPLLAPLQVSISDSTFNCTFGLETTSDALPREVSAGGSTVISPILILGDRFGVSVSSSLLNATRTSENSAVQALLGRHLQDTSFDVSTLTVKNKTGSSSLIENSFDFFSSQTLFPFVSFSGLQFNISVTSYNSSSATTPQTDEEMPVMEVYAVYLGLNESYFESSVVNTSNSGSRSSIRGRGVVDAHLDGSIPGISSTDFEADNNIATSAYARGNVSSTVGFRIYSIRASVESNGLENSGFLKFGCPLSHTPTKEKCQIHLLSGSSLVLQQSIISVHTTNGSSAVAVELNGVDLVQANSSVFAAFNNTIHLSMVSSSSLRSSSTLTVAGIRHQNASISLESRGMILLEQNFFALNGAATETFSSATLQTPNDGANSTFLSFSEGSFVSLKDESIHSISMNDIQCQTDAASTSSRSANRCVGITASSSPVTVVGASRLLSANNSFNFTARRVSTKNTQRNENVVPFSVFSFEESPYRIADGSSSLFMFNKVKIAAPMVVAMDHTAGSSRILESNSTRLLDFNDWTFLLSESDKSDHKGSSPSGAGQRFSGKSALHLTGTSRFRARYNAWRVNSEVNESFSDRSTSTAQTVPLSAQFFMSNTSELTISSGSLAEFLFNNWNASATGAAINSSVTPSSSFLWLGGNVSLSNRVRLTATWNRIHIPLSPMSQPFRLNKALVVDEREKDALFSLANNEINVARGPSLASAKDPLTGSLFPHSLQTTLEDEDQTPLALRCSSVTNGLEETPVLFSNNSFFSAQNGLDLDCKVTFQPGFRSVQPKRLLNRYCSNVVDCDPTDFPLSPRELLFASFKNVTSDEALREATNHLPPPKDIPDFPEQLEGDEYDSHKKFEESLERGVFSTPAGEESVRLTDLFGIGFQGYKRLQSVCQCNREGDSEDDLFVSWTSTLSRKTESSTGLLTPSTSSTPTSSGKAGGTTTFSATQPTMPPTLSFTELPSESENTPTNSETHETRSKSASNVFNFTEAPSRSQPTPSFSDCHSSYARQLLNSTSFLIPAGITMNQPESTSGVDPLSVVKSSFKNDATPTLKAKFTFLDFLNEGSIQVDVPFSLPIQHLDSADEEHLYVLEGYTSPEQEPSNAADFTAVGGKDYPLLRNVSNLQLFPETNRLSFVVDYREPPTTVEKAATLRFFVNPSLFPCPGGLPFIFNFSLVILPVVPEATISPEVRKTVNTLAVTVSALGTPMNGPGLALTQLRINALTQLSLCYFSHTQPLSRLEAPLGLAVGRSHGRYYRGAILGNLFLFVSLTSFFLLLTGVILSYRKIFKKQARFSDGTLRGELSDVLATLHMPSVLLVPAAMGFQGTVSAAMALFIHSDDPTDICLAVFGGVFCAAIVTPMVFLSTKFFPLKLQRRGDTKSDRRRGKKKHQDADEGDGQNYEMQSLTEMKAQGADESFRVEAHDCVLEAKPFGSCASMEGSKRRGEDRKRRRRTLGEAKGRLANKVGSFFSSDYHWVDPAPRTRWKRRYLFMILDYRVAWFTAFEFGFSLFLGAIEGIRISNRRACLGQATAFCLAFLVMFLGCTALQPAFTKFQQVFILLLSFLGLVSSIILLYGFQHKSDQAVELTGVITFAMSICATLKFLVDIGSAVQWGFRGGHLQEIKEKLGKLVQRSFLPSAKDKEELLAVALLQEELEQGPCHENRPSPEAQTPLDLSTRGDGKDSFFPLAQDFSREEASGLAQTTDSDSASVPPKRTFDEKHFLTASGVSSKLTEVSPDETGQPCLPTYNPFEGGFVGTDQLSLVVSTQQKSSDLSASLVAKITKRGGTDNMLNLSSGSSLPNLSFGAGLSGLSETSLEQPAENLSSSRRTSVDSVLKAKLAEGSGSKSPGIVMNSVESGK